MDITEDLKMLASIQALREILMQKINQAIKVKDHLEDIACMQTDMMQPLQPNEKLVVQKLTQEMKLIFEIF